MEKHNEPYCYYSDSDLDHMYERAELGLQQAQEHVLAIQDERYSRYYARVVLRQAVEISEEPPKEV